MAQYSLSPPASSVQIKTCASSSAGARDWDLKSATHHGNAARKAHKNQSFSQPLSIWQKSPCQSKLSLTVSHVLLDTTSSDTGCSDVGASHRDAGSTYHEQRGDDPVHHQAEPQLYPQLLGAECQMQRLVLHLAEDRVHHDEEADGYKASARGLVYVATDSNPSMTACRYICASLCTLFVPFPQGSTRHHSNIPIGIDTPTNFPLCSAGPVLGTKFPSKIPIIIASRIHNASRRSSQLSCLMAETCCCEACCRAPRPASDSRSGSEAREPSSHLAASSKDAELCTMMGAGAFG
ncbi:hypothetical protein MRB53_041990 [Persea americana]|nr:hypothetical protein MRB53_041990 [Persea americana]